MRVLGITKYFIGFFVGLMASVVAAKSAGPMSIDVTGVGSISINAEVNSIYKSLDHRQTKLIDLFREEMFDPSIEIYDGNSSGGKPSMRVNVACKDSKFVIDGISVLSAKIKLANTIGVGSTLADIRKAYKKLEIIHEEGVTVAVPEGIKISFTLEESKIPKAYYDSGDDKSLPSDLKITAVYVH